NNARLGRPTPYGDSRACGRAGLSGLQQQLRTADLASCVGNSKAECRRKFQLPRTLSESHPGDDSGATAIDASISWISRTDVVEDIEGIHTELGCDVLVDRCVLRHGKVGIEERWAKVIVTSNIAELIEERSGK